MSDDRLRQLIEAKQSYRYGFQEPDRSVLRAPKGLSRAVVDLIADQKQEPDWMRQLRYAGLKHFLARPLPTWGADLSGINFDDIYYYIKPSERQAQDWNDVPPEIRRTFDRLKLPKYEQEFLAGVGAQYDSENVYHSILPRLAAQGVIFTDVETATQKYPDLVRQYFSTIIPPNDNKFAALNTAVWSGGSFVYVPKNVHVELPLQAYFRINASQMGQFERTLIIADEGSFVHYIEGCHLAGALVRTRHGFTPIEMVKEGDEVFTHRGRYRKVRRTLRRRYRGPMYRIGYFGDTTQELWVTREHPFLVVRRQRVRERNRDYPPVWLTAAEVRRGDYLAVPVPRAEQPSRGAFRTDVSIGHGRHASTKHAVQLPLEPDFFRLLGYFFSEGHVSHEHYVTFSFHIRERQYLRDVSTLLRRYFGKAPIKNKPRHQGQTLVLSSSMVARVFAREFGSTAYEKRIPAWVRNAPSAHLRQLVKGMWRGDGSYDASHNMFRFNSITRDLAFAFRDSLLRLGIAASINLQQRRRPRRPIYTVIVSSPANPRFGAIVGRSAPAGRRRGSPFSLDAQYLYLPVRSITVEQMDRTVYNLSVEEDESYVGAGVISHNCSAPIYQASSLHSAVVEIVAKRGARVRYTTVQNWSKNVYNLVTKRAWAEEDATVEWVDFNFGSQVTMKYPSVFLAGRGARADILSMAFAGAGQHQDAGGKAVHLAPDTTSVITSKSVSQGGGRTTYRGLLSIAPQAVRCRSKVSCDALILDPQSASDTYPTMKIGNAQVSVEHEATVTKISEAQLFYLQSRGLPALEAAALVVNGFIEPLVKELPLEYAVEMNRLIALEMEGSVG